MDKFKELEPLVGNTPLMEITLKYKGDVRKIYGKAEYYNYTGSIKDRIAFYILKRAYELGTINGDSIIVEATSGNTGIAFCAIGRFLGHRVKIFMPEWMSEERKILMRNFGAELRLVTEKEGGFVGSIELADEEAKKNGSYFLPHQFSNEHNSEAHYSSTAPELEKQLSKFGRTLDFFAAGVGTGGTIMGINSYFMRKNRDFKSFPIEPSTSAILSGSRDLKNHKILGIGDGAIPEIVRVGELSTPMVVEEDDAIIVSQMMAKVFGLGVGISSGANVLGVLKAQDRTGGKGVFATVFADDNKKYLTTDYSRELEIKDNYLCGDIEFLDMKAIR
ncbi:MAG: cysteine synthase family protein [Rickettsiales bacterium]|jgi:cysteine synthase A|nr:cysteine synthase family protein [Rickettsiales bacterium]